MINKETKLTIASINLVNIRRAVGLCFNRELKEKIEFSEVF